MARRNKPVDVFRHIDMSGGGDACWPWKGATGGGTGRSKARPYFALNGQKVIAYRLVWELMKGEKLTSDVMLCHQCDNSICCNPAHLEKGDHARNTHDMVSRDRHGLPSHVVRRIRTLLLRGNNTQQEIADLYGIDRTIVSRIKNDEIHTQPEDYPDTEDLT